MKNANSQNKWKKRRFDQIFQFLKTANNPRDDLSEYENNNDFKYIHYGDVHTHPSVFLDCSETSLPFISRKKINNIPLVKDGDLVMVDASEDYVGLGKSVEIQKSHNIRMVAGLHTFLLRGNNEYLTDGFKAYVQFIPEFRRFLNILATGVSVYGISKNNLKNIEISLPDPSEQLKIARTLTETNSLINSLEKLIEKKKNIKQGAMQELLTGKRRLEGFRGEWETEKLGNYIIFQNGYPLSSKYFNQKSKGFRIIKNRDLKSDDSIYYYSGDIPKRFFVMNGDILIGMDGDFITCLWEKDTAILNQRVGRLLIKKTCNLIFFYYYLQESLEKIQNETSATTVKHLSSKTIENLELPIPSFEEQNWISDNLLQIDHEIKKLENQLNKYKKLKQGMMQKLLTGEIRLV